MILRAVLFEAVRNAGTVEALDRYVPGWELADVSEDEGSYWRALARLWDGDGYDLLTVEHDIEVHEHVVPQLESCSGGWCVFPYGAPTYPPGVTLDEGLGCTRFSASLRAAVPVSQVLEAATSHWLDSSALLDNQTLLWSHIDGPVAAALRKAGYLVCLHWPPVGHRLLLGPGIVDCYLARV